MEGNEEQERRSSQTNCRAQLTRSTTKHILVGAGQKLEPQTFLLQDRFLKLLCAYYAWDAIPQFFLSFRIYSAPCLGGQKTEFITSNNYLKFCKRFESM